MTEPMQIGELYLTITEISCEPTPNMLNEMIFLERDNVVMYLGLIPEEPQKQIQRWYHKFWNLNKEQLFFIGANNLRLVETYFMSFNDIEPYLTRNV